MTPPPHRHATPTPSMSAHQGVPPTAIRHRPDQGPIINAITKAIVVVVLTAFLVAALGGLALLGKVIITAL